MELELFESNWQQQLEIAVRVLLAGVFGGLVGLERELANRPAGLRTHAILGASTALFVGLAELLVLHFQAATAAELLRADPIRIIEATVTGVAFLGAGTIFRHAQSVEGLTTAASMLLVAAIGIAVALGQLLLAAIVTALALLLLRVLSYFGNRDR
jgi:putative Mg2+ transporter-C (MgtC) family protein